MLSAIRWNWEAISSVATAVAALGGAAALILGWRQVKYAADQRAEERMAAQLTADTAVSQAYGQISQQWSALLDVFLDHPEWKPYFYENWPVPKHDALLRGQLETVSELIVGFIDGLVEQRNTVPRGRMDWSVWDAYFRFLFDNSPALQSYIVGSIEFYPDYTFAPLGLIVVRDSLTGKLRGTWHAREIVREPADPENPRNHEQVEAAAADRALLEEVFGNSRVPAADAGYPWVRTWVIVRTDDQWDSTFVASVEAKGPRSAGVRVRWKGDRDDAAEDTLTSWVLGTLTGSSLIVAAELEGPADPPDGPALVFVISSEADRPDPDDLADRVSQGFTDGEGFPGDGDMFEKFLIPRFRRARPER